MPFTIVSRTGPAIRLALLASAFFALCCFVFKPAVPPFGASQHVRGSIAGPAPARFVQSDLNPTTLRDTPRQHIVNTYGKLPLSFEANEGQTDSRVKFFARGMGQTLFLTATELILLRTGSETTPRPRSAARILPFQPAESGRQSSPGLTLKLLGASPTAEVRGLDELSGRRNYFIGHDPARWRRNLRHYARVRYKDVYPGVDLVYYSNQSSLEFDFIVTAGADASAIKLTFPGAEQIDTTPEGDLLLRAQSQEVRLKRPFVYQDLEKVRREVSGAYRLNTAGEVSFELGPYDASQPLVIDPVLWYSTFLGGFLLDFSLGVTVDASGDAYLTGFTVSPNFPTTTSAWDRSCGTDGICNLTGLDAFVTKINAADSAIVFSTFLGGSDNDYGYGIATDGSGVYVTGYTSSRDFPTVAALQPANAGGQDIFVAKLSPEGSRLLYSTYLGGARDDVTFAGADVHRGSVYVTGFTSSANFPTTAGAFDRTCGTDGSCNGLRDAFLARINTALSGPASLTYSTFLGGNNEDEGRAATVDAAGNAYATGFTVSPDFPVTPGALDQTCGIDGACSGGFRDAFVVKFAPETMGRGSLVFSTLLGGAATEVGRAIAVDASNNVYVAGSTGSTDFPTVRAFQSAFGGGPEDGFAAKLNSQGSALLYSTYLGGSGEDVSHGIAADPAGNIYVAGYTTSTNFPVSNPLQGASAGGEDAFVAKLNPMGAAVYATYMGGSNDDRAFDVAADSLGNAYVVGFTGSGNFPIARALRRSSAGAADAFVAKILDGPPVIDAGGIVNGASFSPRPPAPGSIASLFGVNVSLSTVLASGLPLPVTLEGATVRINNIAVPLFFVSPTQINFQLPWELAAQPQASVTVTIDGLTSGAATVNLAAFGPGLFSTNQRGAGQGAVLLAGTPFLAAPEGAFPGARPARRGDSIEIYATGLGSVTNPPRTGSAATSDPLSLTVTTPSVSIGNPPAMVTFSGLAPGFVGLYQVNAQVPPDAPTGSAIPVALTIGGITSNTVTIAVR